MSDLQLLFLVLAALYGWECACWLRRGSVAFTTWLGRSWREAHPGTFLGNQRGGFIFAQPLPPLGALLTANQLPLSLSPDAALAYVATNVNHGWRPAQTGRFLLFDDIQEVRERGRKVMVNGEVWLTAPSTSFARRIAEELTRLTRLRKAERADAVSELIRASLDECAVAQRWQNYQAQSSGLRGLTNALFVYVFVFAPVLIWYLGFKLSWLGLLLGLLAPTTTTAVLFRRAHRVLYPNAEDERFTHTLTIALAPTSALRAHDALSRPLMEMFHPLAVAKALLPQARFREFARRVLLDLRHPALPLCPSEDAVQCATELHARSILRQAAEQLLKRSGVEPDELCRAPAPADETCRAYCLRCGAQFTKATGTCTDCGGLALVAFPAAR
jgi:hypothetical protein